MASDKRRKGFSAERELVRKLWRYGFAAIRGPASGAKVKKSVYPDVVAIYKGKVLVFEVKAREKLQTIYMRKSQLDKLLEFARRAGGEAYIAIKVGELRDWRFVSASSVEVVNDNRVKIPKEAVEKAPSFQNLISSILIKTLDEYLRNEGRRD